MTVDSSSTTQESGYLAGLDVPAGPALTDAKPAAAPSPAEKDTPASAGADAKPAGSSDADAKAGDAGKGAKAPPKTALDAVLAVIEQSKAEEQPPGSKDGQEKTADAPASAEKAEDGKDGDQPPFHEHPRWKEVNAKLKAAEEKSQSFDQFVGGVAQAGLSMKEFNDGLHIMALMKRDPDAALKALNPYIDQLRSVLGDVLPDDLKQAIENGEISEQHARETSRLRAKNKMGEQREQQSAEEAQETRFRDHANACKLAANTWETAHAATDPDWAKKQPRVREKVELYMTRYGFPPTPEDAVKLMKAMTHQVEAELRQLLPAKPKVEQPRPAGGASSSHAPAPKTREEVVRLALGIAADA